jgi:dihydroflavonol-4-reductase
MKQAFVTGATGFLGVNLVKQLHDLGWQITAIHRNPINHPLLQELPVKWVHAALDDVHALQAALPQSRFTVFHVAADTAQWKPLHKRQYQTNVTGTANLIEAVQGKDLDRFIHVSSVLAYGLYPTVIKDDSPSLAEHSKHNYSITKWQSEQLVKRAIAEENLPAVILNPCHVIGPWDTNNWVQLFKAVIEDDLPGIPPAQGVFAWVEEVANALITASTKGKIGENYILGGPHLPMKELVNEIQKQLGKPISKKAHSVGFLRSIEPFFRISSWFTGKEPQLTPDKVLMLTHNLRVDDSKAQRELGYVHKTPEEIVHDTLAWLKAHAYTTNSDHLI